MGIAFLSLYEYGLILSLGGRQTQRGVLTLGGAGVAATQVLGGPGEMAAAALAVAVILRELFASERSLDRAALTMFGVVMFGWLPAHLALIRDDRPHGEVLTFLFFVTIWVMDSAAYFAGNAFGKHQLSDVSPKKTWEGFFAGLIGATACIFVFRAYSPEALPFSRALTLAVVIGILGQISDLAESMIKRAAGVKDSSNLLPGHGGVMDRFDSFILSAPAFYYCLRFT